MPPNAPGFGWMSLQRETILLHTTASASNGTWDGIVIIRVINGRPETREIVQGRFFSDDSTLTVDEVSAGFPAEDRKMSVAWGAPLFVHYGVPPVTGDKVTTSCQEMQAQFLR
jgi:hypothetical protein